MSGSEGRGGGRVFKEKSNKNYIILRIIYNKATNFKNRGLSYGYHMGILRLSYGEGSRVARKWIDNGRETGGRWMVNGW